MPHGKRLTDLILFRERRTVAAHGNLDVESAVFDKRKRPWG
jgi:hypothetical protein